MRVRARRWALGILAAFLLSTAASVAFAIREEMREETLMARLQHGGYVVYLRHAQRYKGAPDQFGPDSPPSAFADCTHQRNLTPYGRGQAALLGEELRRAGVKVGLVLAHPECRARDTAILALGHAKLERGMFSADFVRRQLGITPLPGTNTFLVGGEYVLRQIIGAEIAPAEMAVFQPDGHGGAKLVGRLKAKDLFDD